MQKKIICTMITTALVMSLFTGCGTKESGSNTAKKDDYIRALKKSDSKKELGFFSYFHYNRNIRRERLPC